MNHHDYMSLALQLAEKGRGTVSPNPMVGCVIVNNEQIVGRGYHQQAGGPHAEIHALRQAGEAARGATVYVTLEPCQHTGLTPPCTNALIQAGVSKVYAACLDPNPLVAGRGVAALEQAGIEVAVGLCADAAKKSNVIFFHYITQKRPYVIAKWAMSLDGKTITATADSRQISGDASQQHTHALRQEVDAILVGANTARCDNPRLLARDFSDNSLAAKQPLRIILASEGSLPGDLLMLQANYPGKTIIATTKPITIENAEVIVLPKNKQQQVCLPSLLDELGKRKITSILVEGGMTVHESFINEQLVNEWRVYIAPVLIGSLPQKQAINVTHTNHLGGDMYIQASASEVNHV